jgi:hypothetical protein
MSFEVPILLCVFNRPELTARTFEAIARQKPKTLLVASDGPRTSCPDDDEQVERTRQIVQAIDWDCNFQACFLNENLGCRQQMARAISWGFEQSERLIILEDDCLPDPSFFKYCESLLERYAEHAEVMTIGGINHLNLPCQTDYRFSKYPFIWGWASWRRAWQKYDLEMKCWQSPVVQKQVLDCFTETAEERAYWNNIFDAQSKRQINTWDYSWTFASWLNQGLSIVPRKNLVTNIGFGELATHTVDHRSQLANRAASPFPLLRHPGIIEQDKEWDRAAADFYFPPQPIRTPISVRKPRRSYFARLFQPSRGAVKVA